MIENQSEVELNNKNTNKIIIGRNKLKIIENQRNSKEVNSQDNK